MSRPGVSHVTLMHESRHTTGDTYLEILKAVKEEQPDMHVHAFSPLEVSQGAATLNTPVLVFLPLYIHFWFPI